mmetsp:Transcript_4249/g.8282  ORF Transcript_4249/g.8282 Transcript_4249/m.8282 type:complete len:88 (+) Transcript_4249:644-907(+)
MRPPLSTRFRPSVNRRSSVTAIDGPLLIHSKTFDDNWLTNSNKLSYFLDGLFLVGNGPTRTGGNGSDLGASTSYDDWKLSMTTTKLD